MSEYVKKPSREFAEAPTGDVVSLAPQIASLIMSAGGLGRKVNDKGNSYFTSGLKNFTPQRFEYTDSDGKRWTCLLGGQVNINLTQVREAALAEAATVETVKTAVAKLTPEQREALLEELMADS